MKRKICFQSHIVYLWHVAGRVRTCPSGYEPDYGNAGLCRRNSLRFRTRSARRYTICRLKVVIMGDVQYEQLPTFDLKRGNAQKKHSLPTRRADSAPCMLVGLAQVWSSTAPTAWTAIPKRANVRACGEPRVLGTPKRDESLHASHAHRVARRWALAGPRLQPGHGNLTTVG